jgi:hypothetical protein
MRARFNFVLLIAAGMLASCGGGGGSNPVQGASPGGIWRGTDSASGLTVVGLFDETGSGNFIRADNAVFLGTVSTSQNSISVSAGGYAAFNKTFPDGSTHGVLTMNGTIQERQSISAATKFTTDAGNSTQGSLDLTFDKLYNRPSSLATVAGGYTGDLSSLFPYVKISPDGSIDAGSVLICRTGGQISLIDPAYNLYRVQLTTTCDNGSGTTESGLATLDNTMSPEALVIGLADTGGPAPAADVRKWFHL